MNNPIKRLLTWLNTPLTETVPAPRAPALSPPVGQDDPPYVGAWVDRDYPRGRERVTYESIAWVPQIEESYQWYFEGARHTLTPPTGYHVFDLRKVPTSRACLTVPGQAAGVGEGVTYTRTYVPVNIPLEHLPFLEDLKPGELLQFEWWDIRDPTPTRKRLFALKKG